MAEQSRLRIDTTTGTYYSDPQDEDLTPLLEGAERTFKDGDGKGHFTIQEHGTKTVLNFRYIVAISGEEVSNEPPF